MKFHACTLCLAAVLAFAGAARAERVEPVSITETGETLYWRPIYFPDLQPAEVTAAKIQQIVAMNQQEAAELRALAARARTTGWENIAYVYDAMADDHVAAAGQGTTWLAMHQFPAPAPPQATLAADVAPETTVDQQIAEHQREFEEALAARRGEPSPAVRGLWLLTAATAARHLSLLRTLDTEVERGRRVVSARLRSMVEPGFMATDIEALAARIAQEDRELLGITTEVAAAPTPAEAPAAAAPAPQPQVVERIVERPVIVERVVEKPVIVERVVERPAPQMQQPARVLGRQQTIRRMRRPAR